MQVGPESPNRELIQFSGSGFLWSVDGRRVGQYADYIEFY
jgi:hypothetical protein